MEPRTILLTGGNRGLGRATAEALARLGHRVIITARDPDRGAAACREIAARAPGARVEARPLDLASMASIHRLADAWGEAGGEPIDVLFHNAGVMQQSPTRRTTADGFEETLAVNTLAPMLLTQRMLPFLGRSPAASASPAARVVCVSSRLHYPGSRGAPVDFDFEDPQLTRGYDPERAYKNSKLALLWFTYELSRRLPPRPVTANAVCPGFVPTTAAASTTGMMRLFMRYVLPFFPFATRVETAAGHFVELATDPALTGVSGRFYADGKDTPSSEESRDPEKARRFWALANGLLGLPDWP